MASIFCLHNEFFLSASTNPLLLVNQGAHREYIRNTVYFFCGETFYQIRLQLETLLAEKARLAHENETYARENRFLREIVEYHQLTMQDVVYLDEGIEEVTEVYPIPSVSSILSMSPTSPKSPPSPAILPASASGSLKTETESIPKNDNEEVEGNNAPVNSDSSVNKEEDQRGQSGSYAEV